MFRFCILGRSRLERTFARDQNACSANERVGFWLGFRELGFGQDFGYWVQWVLAELGLCVKGMWNFLEFLNRIAISCPDYHPMCVRRIWTVVERIHMRSERN